MNKIYMLLVLFCLSACKNKKADSDNLADIPEVPDGIHEDNAELAEIYRVDQSDRQVEKIDWDVVSANDRAREARVYELIKEGALKTSNDFHNAAMIFQHGMDQEAYGMAVKLMTKAVELDPSADKWLLAAATDRYLLSKDEPQIYGTQYFKMNEDDPWEMQEMDTTQITDAQRREYRVETLAEQREKLRRMNQKKLSSKLAELNSIDKLIEFINNEDLQKSNYDISESGINSFGYSLMRESRDQDALKIFEMNTQLYPEAFNTHDSYGECLLKLGDKANALIAYKKSLELNPNNEGAAKIIADMQAN